MNNFEKCFNIMHKSVNISYKQQHKQLICPNNQQNRLDKISKEKQTEKNREKSQSPA